MNEETRIYAIYASSLSVVTSLDMLHNMSKLQHIYLHPSVIARGTVSMMPTQVMMRFGQIYVSSYITNLTNSPLLGFGSICLTQEVIYNHAMSRWDEIVCKSKNLTQKPKVGSYRGLLFSIPRDMISQGIPYYFSTPLSLLAVSAMATVASQGLHNCQMLMRTDPKLTYRNCLPRAYSFYGKSLFYAGATGRLGLMAVVNVVNACCLNSVYK